MSIDNEIVVLGREENQLCIKGLAFTGSDLTVT